MYEEFHGAVGKLTPNTLTLIKGADMICREYQQQGLTITLRQLYYQFVARGFLANKQQNYDMLGKAVTKGRLAGMIDWSALEDRTRDVTGNWAGYMPSAAEVIEQSAKSYGFDLWHNQPRRIEVWVEKQALVDIVARAANRFRVASFACKGYVSLSEMYSAGERMQEYIAAGQEPLILHLGDHDPSGIDMTRDIEERLSMFSYADVEVRRIALNMDQVEQYDPPPNPAKFTDSRVHSYVSQFGYSSWELDALDPATLTALVTEHIEREIDLDEFNRQAEQENNTRDLMKAKATGWAMEIERIVGKPGETT